MQLNADFSRRALVHAGSLPWTPSPTLGVERRMLDRIGDEVARATSIVRYAPDSVFPAHTHGGGEEYLVLEGVFQDENGDHPEGTYVRNPPGSRHAPRSATGCTLFVKLWQFHPDDRTAVRLETAERTWLADPSRSGVGMIPLHRDDWEAVRLEHWPPNSVQDIAAHDGLEVLVLDGGFREDMEEFEELSWLRMPPGDRLRVHVGRTGARVWLKAGRVPASLALTPPV